MSQNSETALDKEWEKLSRGVGTPNDLLAAVVEVTDWLERAKVKGARRLRKEAMGNAKTLESESNGDPWASGAGRNALGLAAEADTALKAPHLVAVRKRDKKGGAEVDVVADSGHAWIEVKAGHKEVHSELKALRELAQKKSHEDETLPPTAVILRLCKWPWEDGWRELCQHGGAPAANEIGGTSAYVVPVGGRKDGIVAILSGAMSEQRRAHEAKAVVDTSALCAACSEALVDPLNDCVLAWARRNESGWGKCVLEAAEEEAPRGGVEELLAREEIHVSERSYLSLQRLINFFGGEKERERWEWLRNTKLIVHAGWGEEEEEGRPSEVSEGIALTRRIGGGQVFTANARDAKRLAEDSPLGISLKTRAIRPAPFVGL